MTFLEIIRESFVEKSARFAGKEYSAADDTCKRRYKLKLDFISHMA